MASAWWCVPGSAAAGSRQIQQRRRQGARNRTCATARPQLAKADTAFQTHLALAAHRLARRVLRLEPGPGRSTDAQRTGSRAAWPCRAIWRAVACARSRHRPLDASRCSWSLSLLIRLHGSIHSKRLPTARRLLALPLQQPIQKRKETKTYPRLSCKIEYLLNVKSQRRINRFRILHGRLVNSISPPRRALTSSSAGPQSFLTIDR